MQYILGTIQINKNKVLCNVSTGHYPGFIDFIVSPTLAVCGDMVAAVLGEEAEVRKVFFIRNLDFFLRCFENECWGKILYFCLHF